MTFNAISKVKAKYVPNYLRNQRVKIGLTQFELAKSLKTKRKIHVQFVSNWERGLCDPPRHIQAQLMKVLEVDFDTIERLTVKDASEKARRQLQATIRKDIR